MKAVGFGKADQWWPSRLATGSVGTARWDSYRKKRFLGIDVRMTNFRMWMETHREHVYAANIQNKRNIDTENSSDMERLHSLMVHWDFWHEHDVHTTSFGLSQIAGKEPERWMEKLFYKRRLYPRTRWHLRYKPRFGGSMGWNADAPGTVEQPPTGKVMLPRSLDEWFDDAAMRTMIFTGMLRIHGCSPVEVESVRLKTGGQVALYKKW